MPWSTPTLSQVRSLVRDYIQASLPGADAMVPNSVLRVMSDAMGALCHLTLQYVDWLARQLMPDTAEAEWLDRHADIWLVNADGSVGRKSSSLASGSVTMTSVSGLDVAVPQGTQMSYATNVVYETLADVTASDNPTEVSTRSITAGTIGNLLPGSSIAVMNPVPDLSSTAIVVTMDGGVDEETDDELRSRLLSRIRQPPMGGDAADYVQWALSYPGVTRAWCSPLEMGMGTVTVRFMMDDLRADYDGFPLPDDVDDVAAYLNTVRPVAVKDLFVEAPIPYPINLRLSYIDPETASTRSAIIASLENEFFVRSQPGQTWYRAWTDEGVMGAAGVNSYTLVASDTPMPNLGDMAVLGDVTYG